MTPTSREAQVRFTAIPVYLLRIPIKNLAVALVCFGLCAALVSAGGEKKSTFKIDGAWVGVGGVSDGKTAPAEVFDKLMLNVTMNAGKYAVTIQGKEIESGSYKVSGEKSPYRLDLDVAEGMDKGKKQVGIVQIEGDIMTVAFAKAGGTERPKNFEGATGEVTMLKRKK